MGLITGMFNKDRTYCTNRSGIKYCSRCLQKPVTKGLMPDVKKLIPEAGACENPLQKDMSGRLWRVELDGARCMETDGSSATLQVSESG